jgi:hypothetical protein
MAELFLHSHKEIIPVSAIPRTRLRLANLLLVLGSVLFCTIVAEGFIREIDGHPLLATLLSDAVGEAAVKPEDLNQVKLASGVRREWFFSDPPALPNRRSPPDEWVNLYRSLQHNPSGGGPFHPSDAFKAWNSAFAADPCRHRLLHHAPGQLFLYDPPDGASSPPTGFCLTPLFPTTL